MRSKKNKKGNRKGGTHAETRHTYPRETRRRRDETAHTSASVRCEHSALERAEAQELERESDRELEKKGTLRKEMGEGKGTGKEKQKGKGNRKGKWTHTASIHTYPMESRG